MLSSVEEGVIHLSGVLDDSGVEHAPPEGLGPLGQALEPPEMTSVFAIRVFESSVEREGIAVLQYIGPVLGALFLWKALGHSAKPLNRRR